MLKNEKDKHEMTKISHNLHEMVKNSKVNKQCLNFFNIYKMSKNFNYAKMLKRPKIYKIMEFFDQNLKNA